MRKALADIAAHFNRKGGYSMNKRVRRILLGILAAMLLFGIVCVALPYRAVATGSPAVRDVAYAAEHWVSRSVLQNGVQAACTGGALRLDAGETARFTAELTQTGAYHVYAEYRVTDPAVTDNLVDISCGRTQGQALLSTLWADAEETYPVDPYGNELPPKQRGVEEFFLEALADPASPSLDAYEFSLPAGKAELTITAGAQAVELRELWFVPVQAAPTYAEYRAAHAENAQTPQWQEILEAEKYAVKSDSFLRGGNENDPSLYPYDTFDKRINVLDDSSFDAAGQKVLWTLDVQETGWYCLSFKYTQYTSGSKPVYRTVELDGQTPYRELEAVQFPATGMSQYEQLTLSADGAPLMLWLEQGRHTLALRAVMGPLEKAFDDLMDIMNEVSALGMDLTKLTAGVTDEHRTWDLDVYLPDAVPRVRQCAADIRAVYDDLSTLTQRKPTYAATLLAAAETLDKLADEPRKLPNNTKLLNVGDNCVSKRLGTVIEMLTDLPLGLDQIYLTPGTELPTGGVSLVHRVGEGIKSFAGSFLPGRSGDYAASSQKDDGELTVWVNRPIQYVQALQQLVDAGYNQIYHANVRLSVMPNEQKLILSNASGTSPDLVLGVNYWTPFDFAIRGAAKDLTEYDDFLEFYAEQYNLESLVPLYYNDGVYGAVETQDFQVLYYRRDILQALGLEIPETWNDVKKMMPELLRYSMNFNLPLANLVGFKSYHVTAPYIYQNGGAFYADDGMSTAILQKGSVEGFEEMTEIFTIYGAQQSVPSFFQSFRFGQTPLGISGFSTYMQLQEAAPELKGVWDIAPVPGTLTEEGEIFRYQMADSTACMIFENTDKPDEAWQFLKWWLSEDTQIEYAYNLRASFGPEYQWNTANLLAFAQLDYPEEHKRVILEQWQAQRENLRHPANYMVEREVSNVWNSVVVDGTPLMEALNRAAMTSDREILRKMQEFGFLDENGEIIKTYQTDAYARLVQMLAESREKTS